MVAEPVAETEVITDSPLEPEVVETPAESPAAEPVTETPEASDPDAVLADFLKEQGLETPEGEPAQAEPTPEEREANARREEREKLTREQDEQRQRALKQAQLERFRGRSTALDRHLKETLGVPEAEAGRVIATFNAHHQDLLEIAKDQAALAFLDNEYQEAAKHLSDGKGFIAKRGDHKTTAERYSDFATDLRKGYVKETEVKKQVQTALLAYQKTLRDKGVLPGSKAPESVSGNSTGSRFANATDADAAFNRGDIDATTWKSETARLRARS
jgi:hypothetical protein